MLSDKEAEEIERKRKAGVSGGPIVLAWVDRLLTDRKERVRQLQYAYVHADGRECRMGTPVKNENSSFPR